MGTEARPPALGKGLFPLSYLGWSNRKHTWGNRCQAFLNDSCYQTQGAKGELKPVTDRRQLPNLRAGRFSGNGHKSAKSSHRPLPTCLPMLRRVSDVQRDG